MDARVGSSDHHALFIMIFSFFCVVVVWGGFEPVKKNEKPANCESFARSCRRSTFSSEESSGKSAGGVYRKRVCNRAELKSSRAAVRLDFEGEGG